MVVDDRIEERRKKCAVTFPERKRTVPAYRDLRFPAGGVERGGEAGAGFVIGVGRDAGKLDDSVFAEGVQDGDGAGVVAVGFQIGVEQNSWYNHSISMLQFE